MIQPRYIIVYKKTPKSHVEYLGPFVSERMAEEFKATIGVNSAIVRPIRSREQLHL